MYSNRFPVWANFERMVKAMGLGGIAALLILVLYGAVDEAFGSFWLWAGIVLAALVSIYGFVMDWWNTRPLGGSWFNRLITWIFRGKNQLEMDQDKDDKLVLKKGHHS